MQHALVGLLLVCLTLVPSHAVTRIMHLLLSHALEGSFFQITDIHVDPEYHVGADPLDRCVNQTVNDTDGAGTWGNYKCDSPVDLFSSMLASMKAVNPNPTFIFYTGDSVPHWLDYSNVEFYTIEMVRAGITTVLNMTSQAFPGVPIYPALGNHDNWLSDQLPPPPISNPWFEFIALQWAPWLSADALDTVKQGGYYTLLLQAGLRLISWNSIYCDRINVWGALNFNHSDYSNQFAWLNQTLAEVYIIGHIVPSDYQMWCQERYSAISRDYSDVIVMQFFGDRHSDEFRLVMNDNDPLKATGVIRVAPSLVPFYGHNPAYRYYTYNDATNGTLIDENTYYLVLGNGNQTVANWTLEYNLRSVYGMPDLSTKSFAGLFLLLLTPTRNQIRDDFISFYNSGAPMTCDQGCQSGIVADQLWGPFPQAPKLGSQRQHLAKLSNGMQSVNYSAGKEAFDDELCTLCIAAMTIVDSLLAVNASDEFIIDTLVTKVCPIQDKFPINVCRGFCRLYGPYTLPVVAQQKAATVLCYALPFCDNSMRLFKQQLALA